MKLTDYITEHHSGNISDFARSQGVSSSQVARWLKRDCLIDNGDVYCKISKRIKKECE